MSLKSSWKVSNVIMLFIYAHIRHVISTLISKLPIRCICNLNVRIIYSSSEIYFSNESVIYYIIDTVYIILYSSILYDNYNKKV